MFVPISDVKFHADILPSLQFPLSNRFMDIPDEKNPESQENILLRITVLSNYAKGLQSHVRERYF